MALGIRRGRFYDEEQRREEPTTGPAPLEESPRQPLGGQGFIPRGFDSLVPRRRGFGAQLGQTAKEQGIGRAKDAAKQALLDKMFPPSTASTVIDPTTGQPVTSTSFPESARGSMFPAVPGTSAFNPSADVASGASGGSFAPGAVGPASGGTASDFGTRFPIDLGGISGGGFAGLGAGAGTSGAEVAANLGSQGLGDVGDIAATGFGSLGDFAIPGIGLGIGALMNLIQGKNPLEALNPVNIVKGIGHLFGLGDSGPSKAWLTFPSHVASDRAATAHGLNTLAERLGRTANLDQMQQAIREFNLAQGAGGRTGVTAPEGWEGGGWGPSPQGDWLSPGRSDIHTAEEFAAANPFQIANVPEAGTVHGHALGDIGLPQATGSLQDAINRRVAELRGGTAVSAPTPTSAGTTVPGQGAADVGTSLNPPSPGFLAGAPVLEGPMFRGETGRSTPREPQEEPLRLHEGGIVPGEPGTEHKAILRAGETVFPTGFHGMGSKSGQPLQRIHSMTVKFAHDKE